MSNKTLHKFLKKIIIVFVNNRFMIFILLVSCWDNFILFAVRNFLLQWEFFFSSENFSFAVRVFLLQREFSFFCKTFFLHENFYFVMRIFVLLWEFFVFLDNFYFAVRTFSRRNFPLKVKVFGKPYKKYLAGYVAYA